MNIAIKNLNGINENVVVVRYFQFNGANYLIFTKNEVDESGYQKLYISKIVNMVGNAIPDDVEWNLLRDTIKVIAKANKENTTLPVQDLNEVEINGIQIVGEKPFKLTSASVALLSANKVNNTNVNLNNMNGLSPQISTVTNNAQPMPATDTVVSGVVPTINNISTPISNIGIPNNIDNNSINTNSLQSGNIQNLNNSVSSNIGVESINSFDSSVVNSNLVSNPFVSVPTDFTAPNTEVQAVVPNFNGNKVVENTTDNNLQQNLYSNLQTPVASNLESIPNLNETPSSFEASVPVEPVIDYKKLYEEQTLKLNAITVELDKYKNIIEQLKNILN